MPGQLGGIPISSVGPPDDGDVILFESLAAITLWKVREPMVFHLDRLSCLLRTFQTMSDKDPSSAAGLCSLLSQLIEEECRLLLDAWDELLLEAEGVRAQREVDEVAAKIAYGYVGGDGV